MSDEDNVMKGILESLRGLKTVIDVAGDTGELVELGVGIQTIINTTEQIIVDASEPEYEVDIKVSKEVAAKTISWANYGWHTSYVGPDGVHYMWLRG